MIIAPGAADEADLAQSGKMALQDILGDNAAVDGRHDGWMTAHRQVPLSWAHRHAAFAVQKGVSLERLFERAMITPHHGDDRDTISRLQLTLFQALLVLETNDATHFMLKHRHAPELGPLAFRLLFSGINLADGLKAVIQLFESASSCIRFALSTKGANAFIAIRVDGEEEACVLQEDIQLAYLHQGMSCFLGRAFPVISMTTRDRRHVDLGSTHHAIGCPVTWGDMACLKFSRSLLDVAPLQSKIDEFAWQPVRQSIEFQSTPAPSEVPLRANDLLRIDRMAADRSMASSTFRRKLTSNGISFRRSRQRVLLDATIERLRTRTCSVEAIAEELGYADASSLRRFIKRSTGETPSTLRAKMGMTVPPAQLMSRLGQVIALIASRGAGGQSQRLVSENVPPAGETTAIDVLFGTVHGQ